MAAAVAIGSSRVRHVRGLHRCDENKPCSHLRALRTPIPAHAAAASCVFPAIRFLRNTPTCASVTMESHRLAPLLWRAAETVTTGKSNCRQAAH
jgi:hypothetical protein